MDLSPAFLLEFANRIGAAAQNVMEVARFGGLETDEVPSPFEVTYEHRTYRLRRYFPDLVPTTKRQRLARPPVVLVPPMMLSADVYDVAPAISAVAHLAAAGIDPWVVDFGAPENEEGGLERTLTDHVLAVSDAVDRVREQTGRDVHLGGYSQGGMFCYQAAAYRRSVGLTSVVTFGSPADTSGMVPFGIPEDVAGRVLGLVADNLQLWGLPSWASSLGFKLMDPLKSLRSRIDFVTQLHDRDALLPRERQRRFLMGDGWVAWPAPALADFMRQFVAHNRMLQGGFVIEGRTVTLADISVPVLTFVGEVDEIAPTAAVRAVHKAAPRTDIYETSMRAGHFGLVVGNTAATVTWPTVAAWALWRDGIGEQPVNVARVGDVAESEADIVGSSERAAFNLNLAAGVGLNMARSVVGTLVDTGKTVQSLTGQAMAQLPRLARLEQVGHDTRISLGTLLDEQASSHANDPFFLFEGRSHSYADAKVRIDNVVKGLISIGVRQGEHVGVLMDTRPSGLAAVAALSRLGAIAVMLRPGPDIAREVRLGEVDRIVADPENGALAVDATSVPVYVLGGGGDERDLGPRVTDMERIDPDAVRIPAWYLANPGRAEDLAFILFTGGGDKIRINHITNRRWALSAFGTASAAALSSSDTVYSVTPIHHPSGLLTSIGGAVAGGARLALATRFDPTTFWDEVRRYGVTIVSYTWTLVRDLVEAPPDPAERHHPVRMFIGSGMPAGLWKQVTDRFAPATVLEFYASTEGAAVLVNLSGRKVGSKGRPLPGSAEIRLARYDTVAGRLIEGPDGFAIECDVGETGILLAQARRASGIMAVTPLRGLFSRNDAWIATDDLFHRDEDGDFWLDDHVPALIRTAQGTVPSVPIEDALGRLDEVSLAVAYGVASPAGDDEVAVAAVTRSGGREIDPVTLSEALDRLPAHERPVVVHVVEDIDRTAWFRLRKFALRQAGLPGGGEQFHLDQNSGAYDTSS